MKVFKETALLSYAMVEELGGTHCAIIALKKDK